VNDRLCELVGYTRDELLAMRVADLEVRLTPEELDHAWAGMRSGDRATGYGSLRHRDGHAIPVENHLTVVEEDGTRVFYALLRDVREREALEAQLLQAQKMEAVGQLAGGVAHDFNNLLQVIQGHVSLALDELPPGGPVREDLEAVHAAGERAVRLTRQLLAFSRKQLLQPRVLDPNEVVRDVVPMLRRLIGEDITVEARLAPAVGSVTADPAQLEQVLVNLAVNARDAMPRGGRVVIETEAVALGGDGTPGVRAPAAPGPYVRLTVRDTGVGMDEATRTRAFEPFFTTKPPGRGTGLGLSTVYGIVRQSGGRIAIESAPGAGTAVSVELPCTQAAPTADPARPVRAPGAATARSCSSRTRRPCASSCDACSRPTGTPSARRRPPTTRSAT
jgi:PAS domain S-box-containing protein